MSDDRPHVERLADEWRAMNHDMRSGRTRYTQGILRMAGKDLRAAIEADRAAGWLNPTEATALLAECLREAERRDELRAEVERLREAIRHESKHVADRDAMIADLRSRLDEQHTMTDEYKASRADLGERLNIAEADRDLWQDACDDAEAKLAEVRAALSNHPRCDVHPDDDPVTCGWKSAVGSVQRVLDRDT